MSEQTKERLDQLVLEETMEWLSEIEAHVGASVFLGDVWLQFDGKEWVVVNVEDK